MKQEASPAESVLALLLWKQRDASHKADRDYLVLAADTAGVNIRKIALSMGISRTTVYKIIEESKMSHGMLTDYVTGEAIRPATAGELARTEAKLASDDSDAYTGAWADDDDRAVYVAE